jgi:hypothetical protein
MRAADIQEALSWEVPTVANLFSCLDTLSRYVMEHGATDKVALDAIIRLRDYSERGIIADQTANDAIFALCREAGLFPYLNEADLSWRDQIAYEFFRGPVTLDYVFHREQWRAFQSLLSGRSVVLSAPTSFGKSVLIHALIAQKKPDRVVVIVPTIALLDQFRRRSMRYFGSEYVIITRNDQRVESQVKRIYVLTQERLLDRHDVGMIDLLVIDEYYKLDSRRERDGAGSRATLLNVALRRFMDAAKQIFFLGPTVADIPMRDDLRPRFDTITSEFSPVAVDVHNYRDAEDPSQALASLLQRYGSDKSLIFSKSPPAARRLASYLASRCPLPVTRPILEFADWLAEQYHPRWPLVTALRAGYGMHHGSVPRSVAQALVRLFNEDDLNALVCTSTLIEGVNTTAKNVFIFDKKISNSNFDYFDYRNIAGRSGRMGRHFVGRVFLFHEPPPVTPFQLQIPALGNEDELPDAVLLNLPDETLTEGSRARKQAIFDRSPLPDRLVMTFAQYGEGALESCSGEIRSLLESEQLDMLWRGYVGFPELAIVFELAWRHLRFNKGRLSPREAAFFANRLRIAGTLRQYFDRLVEERMASEYPEAIERGFRALGAFDYAIPKILLDMEALVNYHSEQLGLWHADYSYMAQALDNLFSHHWVKALEEYGIPFPLGDRLSFLVRDTRSLEDAVEAVRLFARSERGARDLLPIEINLIEAAIG